MSLVEKFAQAAARNTTTYTAWMPNPRGIPDGNHRPPAHDLVFTKILARRLLVGQDGHSIHFPLDTQ